MAVCSVNATMVSDTVPETIENSDKDCDVGKMGITNENKIDMIK